MSRSILRARTARSVRRSRLREEAVLFLLRRRRATLRELARATRSSPSRARELLYGGSAEFARGLGLVPIGVVRALESELGVEYELTPRGEREAAALERARAADRLV